MSVCLSNLLVKGTASKWNDPPFLFHILIVDLMHNARLWGDKQNTRNWVFPTLKVKNIDRLSQTLHSNEFKEFVFICELSFLILSEKLFSANLFTRISLTRLLFWLTWLFSCGIVFFFQSVRKVRSQIINIRNI